MDGKVSRRWRTVALVAIGIAIGSGLAATPVSSHVGGTVAHLWNDHLKARTDARYYTKTQGEARYYNVNETVAEATNANQLDGIDSSGFLPAGATAVNSHRLDGIDSSGFLLASSKAVDSDRLDGIDSTGFAPAGHGHAPAAISPQGAGSGLDADKLDGKDSAEFVSGYQIVAANATMSGAAGTQVEGVARAFCPVGKTILGGGAWADAGGGYLYRSYPSTLNGRWFWEGRWLKRADTSDPRGTIALTAFAICGTVTG